MTARLYVSIDRSGLTPRYIASPHMHPGAREWEPVREWHPIETAPKDRPILVAWEWTGLPKGGFEYGVVRWSHEEGMWLEGAADYVGPADYWQEIVGPALPAPPGAQEEGE